MMAFWKDMASAVTMHPDTSTLSNSLGHSDELDNLMWMNTRNAVSEPKLRRYLSDWPVGNHAEEAIQVLGEIGEWERVERSNDLFAVDDYRDNHPDSLFKNEVDAKYYELREEEIKKMRANPSEYTKQDVDRLIQSDIFKPQELIDEGLMTEESWARLQDFNRDALPDLQAMQMEDPNIQAPIGCTDIYFFGMPGAGKSTAGRRLAKILHKDFYDVDNEIKKTLKKSINKIFEEDGEEVFRDTETEIIRKLSSLQGAVISLGGGAIKREENMALAMRNSIIILLNRDIELIKANPNIVKTRPLISSQKSIDKIYQERKDKYLKYADIVINNNDSQGKTLNLIMRELL